VVFDADSFKRLRTIGGPAKSEGDEDPGVFSKPTNVTVNSEGNVYVADTINNRIQIFDADGEFISMFGKAGDGPGYFERPKGIAIDSDGHIWVADAAQGQVQIFDREGHLLGYFGYPGILTGMLGLPAGLYIDKNNRAFVTEQLSGRLSIFRYTTDAEAAVDKAERDKRAGIVSPATQTREVKK
jgi:DNA-binding beta-propeller fold protein YncE